LQGLTLFLRGTFLAADTGPVIGLPAMKPLPADAAIN